MCRSGPTVGAVITIMLAEGLRIGFGTKAVGWDNLVYGVLLVVFIIFLPKGILGSMIGEGESAAQAGENKRSRCRLSSIEGTDKTRTFRI